MHCVIRYQPVAADVVISLSKQTSIYAISSTYWLPSILCHVYRNPLLAAFSIDTGISCVLPSLCLLFRLCLELLLLRNPVGCLVSVQCAGTKDQYGTDFHETTHVIAEEPDTQHKADQLPDVQHYRDSNGRRVGAQDIDTRNAKKLSDSVGQKIDNVLRSRCEELVQSWWQDERDVRRNLE